MPSADGALPARLEVEGLRVGYGDRTVLEGLSFRLEEGVRAAVVGPNGAGKSTLFKALVGILPLEAGRVDIHGRPFGEHCDCVAYVPQREDVDWNLPLTLRDLVAMGRLGRRRWYEPLRKADRDVIQSCMAEMGIADLAERPIQGLSGGQQRRAFLARALTQEPHVLLMDEPFNGVDAPTQDATVLLLDRLRRDGVTVLISTHDLAFASSSFDRVLVLNRRLIAEGPPQEVLTAPVLARAFGPSLQLAEGQAVRLDECGDGHGHGHDHAADKGSSCDDIG